MDSKVFFAYLSVGYLMILLLLITYNKKYADKAIRYHFFAQLMMTFGLFFGAARLYFPNNFFVVLNSVSFILSSFFESLALLTLADALTPEIKKKLRDFSIFGAIFYSASVFIFKDAYIRILVISLISIVIILPAALRVLTVKDGSALRTLLGILFLAMIVTQGIRIADALRMGPDLVVFGPTFGETLTVIALYVYLILGGVGIILLAKEKADERLIRLAHYDGVTGALNRDGFIDAMLTAIEKSSYDNEAFSMIIVDIDDLNDINEINGYTAGDAVIMNTVERLHGIVGDLGFIGRLGGDEFMIFLKGVDRQRLDTFMDTLHESVAKDPPEGIAYTVSLGAAAFDYPAGKDIQFPIVHAACTDALKEAKRKGRNEKAIALT